MTKPAGKRLSESIVPKTLAELASRGTRQFTAPPPMTAFDEWWHYRRNKKLTGKALAKAAYSDALREMGC